LARKILLADDSVTAQNMGRKILADAGYEVLTVNNGSAALKKIAEAKPELIVLDVYMPGYSGLEVCQRLKETSETSRIPILLTVGKLEPFKPEEAKRVRADAFIVKPFEASELLSALTKLEDKIVPRAESSKPGRFARANAAIDDAKYDKAMAGGEDSGWKNRIAFPSKKKKVEEDPATDDPALYNAVNKDLRTVVEHKPSQDGRQQEQANGARVNLEALGTEGLPKDVTPEEIAALAAAAAQVKGKNSEDNVVEIRPQEAASADAKAGDVEIKPEAKEAEAISAPATETKAAVEEKSQAISEVEASVASSNADGAHPAAEKIETGGSVPSVAAYLVESGAPPTVEIGSVNGNGSHAQAEEPVTMAMAAGAEYVASTARWTAVSVAVPADEAAQSLEHEMQKAYAAFAAADAARSVAFGSHPAESSNAPAAEAVAAVTATTVEAEIPRDDSPVAGQEMQLGAAVPVAPLTEAASPVENTEDHENAVRELEAAAAAYEAQLGTPREALTADAFFAATPANFYSTPSTTGEQTPGPVLASDVHHEQPVASSEIEPAKVEESIAQVSSSVPEALTVQEHAAAESSEAVPVETSPVISEPTSQHDSPVRGETGAPGKESEVAESTAAAWASWRKNREADTSPARNGEKPSGGNEEPMRADESAMAVAAGAERAPEEQSRPTEESGEIASIVDSVLADLRPKIVEEISRKLGKKK